jgi:hypothetical protein
MEFTMATGVFDPREVEVSAKAVRRIPFPDMAFNGHGPRGRCPLTGIGMGSMGSWRRVGGRPENGVTLYLSV